MKVQVACKLYGESGGSEYSMCGATVLRPAAEGKKPDRSGLPCGAVGVLARTAKAIHALHYLSAIQWRRRWGKANLRKSTKRISRHSIGRGLRNKQISIVDKLS